MPSWARVFVLLVGMIMWIAIVAVSLFLQQIPSAVIVGFPAALWIALAGGNSIARRRAVRDEPAAAPGTDKGDESA